MAASSNDDHMKKMNNDNKGVTQIDKLAPLMGAKSPGVARIEALNAHTSLINRCFIFFGLFIVAYAYGLDGTLRGTYQPYATAGFQTHSTLATIGQSANTDIRVSSSNLRYRRIAKCDCRSCSGAFEPPQSIVDGILT